MSFSKKWILAGLLACLVGPLSAATQTKADLLLGEEIAAPGTTMMAGVRLQMPAGWHTYWKNPGDSGKGTEITWELPSGVTAGEIQWPVPEKYESEGFYTYVYHDEVVLLVPLTIGNDAVMGPTELKAKVSWLECKETCLPGSGQVSASLVIARESKPSANAAILDEWKNRLPRASEAVSFLAHWDGEGTEDERPLILQATFPSGAGLHDFLPFLAQGYEVGAPTEVVSRNATEIRLRKTVLRFGDPPWPGQVAGLLVGDPGGAAFRVTATIGESPVLAATAGSATASPTSNGGVAGAVPPSLSLMLFYAFLGGLILNIMPCVLPVIALKILGFVQQSKEKPERVRKLGLVYGVGVLCSFLGLAAMVIGLQLAGKAAGWGMQFQNPQFLIVITVLVTLVALNLFGVFEVNLGGGAMHAATKLSSGEGAGGAFFNGVLATVLATPCTAPFLAPALGFAFAQPPWLIVVFFLTIGAGLALPYVVLSFQPSWLKFLPKPGAWMEKFKIAMGFPMLATALWLFSLAANRFGNSGTLWLGLFLVLLSLSAWIYGEFVQRGRKARFVAGLISLVVLMVAYMVTLEGQLNWLGKPVQSTGIQWQPWSADAVARARAAGRPVLVDFTADWCFTCQVNKKTSIDIESVREKLAKIDAVTLLGDFTESDPLISAELKKFGRAGVPLVLVYSADPSQPPQLLPEALTPGIVLGALDRAAAGN